MFDKINVFIRVYDGTRHLVLFGIEKYDFVYNRIRYLIGANGDTMYTISHNHGKIKAESYDSLPLKTSMTFHNYVILTLSQFLTKIKLTITLNIHRKSFE